jgi:hypothetical protein
MIVPSELRTWLFTGADPSVRYRFLRELEDRTEDDPEVVATKSQVGRTGWAADILALQLAEGQWTTPRSDTGQALYLPKYIGTNWRLLVLAELGLTRETPGIARAAELTLTREAGPTGGLGGSSSEVCFTGNCVRMLHRFGYAEDPQVRASIAWLLSTQKDDGGWHCAPATERSGTLDGWEALAAFAAIDKPQRSAEMERAIARGAEFYLERGLVHEGPTPYDPWLRTHFPNHYYYDTLVGLDFLTRLGFGTDPRLRPSVDWLLQRRNRDGSWNLDALHPDIAEGDRYQIETPYYPFALEYPARPSRWITLTALTVLRRVGQL